MRIAHVAVATAVLLLLAPPALHGQAARPVVLYDEAHNNHPGSGSIRGLLDLARAAGAELRIGRAPLDEELTQPPAVLIVSGALAVDRDEFMARFSGPPSATMAPYWSDPAHSAFTMAEVRAVEEWVRAGGALLLVIDHAPQGNAALSLTRALGADVRNGFTWDGHHLPPGYQPGEGTAARRASAILFSRSDGRIADHPITLGWGGQQRVETVATYVGTSILGPRESTSLLLLSDSALDYYRPWAGGPEYRLSAAGRSQAVAYELGSGRVVIVGEASSLMEESLDNGLDNRAFATNLMHWLLRLDAGSTREEHSRRVPER